MTDFFLFRMTTVLSGHGCPHKSYPVDAQEFFEKKFLNGLKLQEINTKNFADISEHGCSRKSYPVDFIEFFFKKF